jgi:hypothetical protein
MINDELTREAKWTESIAVGDRAYVDAIEQQVRGRQQMRVDEQGGSWTLREEHGAFSALEKSSILHSAAEKGGFPRFSPR